MADVESDLTDEIERIFLKVGKCLKKKKGYK